MLNIRKASRFIALSGAAVLGSIMMLQNPVTADAESTAEEPEAVLQLNFDQKNVEDSSGSGNNGTLVGSSGYQDGIKGKAIRIFNTDFASEKAADNYISLKDAAGLDLTKGDFSVKFWTKATAGSSNGGTIFGNKDYTNGSNQGFIIGSFEKDIRANAGDGSSRGEINGLEPVNDGQWHEVVINFDRDQNITGYVDGVKVKEASIAAYKDLDLASGDLNIGADGKEQFGLQDSLLDEFDVYASILSEADIRSDYAATRADYEKESHSAFYGKIKDSDQYDSQQKAGYKALIDQLKDADTAGDVDSLNKLTADLEAAKAKLESSGPSQLESAQVLRYSFDDSTAKDGTKNGNDGEIVGTPEFTEGISGKAIHLVNADGSSAQPADQYIKVPEAKALEFGTQDYSFSLWYKSDPGVSDGGALISNKDFSTGSNLGYTLGVFPEGLRMNFTPQDTARLDLKNAGSVDNDWHQVMVTVDRDNEITAYADGEKSSSQPIFDSEGKTIDAKSLNVGADGLGRFGVNDAVIDEVSFYNEALTPASIADSYQTQKLDYSLQALDQEEKKLADDANVSDKKKADFEKSVNEIKADSKDKSKAARVLKDIPIAIEYAEEPEKETDLTFDVLSDVHLGGSDWNEGETQNYIDALQDIKYLNPETSAIMVPGDITQVGAEEEYKKFFDVTKVYAPAQPVAAVGNHDARWDAADYFKERYLKYNKEYMGDTPEGQMFWDTTINGYHFITLNEERGLKDICYLSQAQLDWLEQTLKQDSDKNKPIFIQIHQTFKDTADHMQEDRIYSDIQFEDNDPAKNVNYEEKLTKILENYSNAVIFTGHVHNGRNLIDVFNMKYGHVVDCPAFLNSSYRQSGSCDAYQVNVKGNQINLRLRNYRDNEWIDANEINFDLDDLDIRTDENDIPADKVKVSANSEEQPAVNAIDNDPGTYWQSAEAPLDQDWIDFKVDNGYKVTGIRYLPRQIELDYLNIDTPNPGLMEQFDIQYSTDGGKTYRELTSAERQAHIRWKSLWFDQAVDAANIRIIPKKTLQDTNCASAAEFHLMGEKKTGESAETGLSLGASGIQVVKQGETLNLAPAGTSADQTVNYAFSKGGIVSVDDKGVLTALKPGMVKVTAKAGDETATVTVRVTQ